MPKTTMHALELPYNVAIKNGKFVFVTKAKEVRCVYDCPDMNETLILSAQRIPGEIHEQAVPIGDVMLGLSDNN